ncbi:MAG: homoserine O-succinyltransferase [Lachnospira sp.]|nr:homoserine O-succinyltransferase [Lachnospira sp.]
MPIRIQSDLPAKAELEEENIFVMDESRALTQEIRELRIVILNLMPIKQDTELQLLRGLSNTPLQIDITFMQLESHVSKNTSASHLKKFYVPFSEVKKRKFDGMIITGAPVEKMDFEQVDYWDELSEVMEWSKTNITSTFHICWGAQAGLYYHYGVKKDMLPKKLSGVYNHKVMNRKEPLVRGFDDVFAAPHSRYTEACRADVLNNPNLIVLADSKDAGVYIVMEKSGKQIFVMGHPEYDRMTLDQEYKRDIEKGIEPDIPVNYYPEDDCCRKPLLSWRSHANNLYTNWLNYYVYQSTPYEWE